MALGIGLGDTSRGGCSHLLGIRGSCTPLTYYSGSSVTSIRSAVPSKLPYGKRDERKKNSAGTGVPRRLDSSDGHRLYLLMRASFHELRGFRSTTLGGCSGICAVDFWTAVEICNF